jgi:cbb3-type cytochrome oxidase maturation protein
MEIIYLLIPLSIVLVGAIIWVFIWAIRSGQFDDLEGPAHRILMDDDGPHAEPDEDETDSRKDAKAPRNKTVATGHCADTEKKAK